MDIEVLFAQPFGTLPDLFRAQAEARPRHIALIDPAGDISYGNADAVIDRVAAALQRDGFKDSDVAAICASSSIPYALVFLGVLRAGGTVAPLAPSATAASLADMGRSFCFWTATWPLLWRRWLSVCQRGELRWMGRMRASLSRPGWRRRGRSRRR